MTGLPAEDLSVLLNPGQEQPAQQVTDPNFLRRWNIPLNMLECLREQRGKPFVATAIFRCYMVIVNAEVCS